MSVPTMWYVRQAKTQISSLIRAFASRLNMFMTVMLLIEHILECLRLKGGYLGSSESTHVQIPHY